MTRGLRLSFDLDLEISFDFRFGFLFLGLHFDNLALNSGQLFDRFRFHVGHLLRLLDLLSLAARRLLFGLIGREHGPDLDPEVVLVPVLGLLLNLGLVLVGLVLGEGRRDVEVRRELHQRRWHVLGRFVAGQVGRWKDPLRLVCLLRLRRGLLRDRWRLGCHDGLLGRLWRRRRGWLFRRGWGRLLDGWRWCWFFDLRDG